MSMTESFLQISFNNQLSLYGGTLAVGTMAVLNSLLQIVLMTLQGLCRGAQPIISFNYGARKYSRVRGCFKLLIGISLSFSILTGTAILCFSEFFVSIFVTDPDAIRLAAWAIKPYFIAAVFAGAPCVCQNTFLALGQAKYSLYMALFRKVVLLIPLIYILPMIMGDSAFAIHFAQPVADLVSDGGRVFSVLFAETISSTTASVVTCIMFFVFYKKHLKMEDSTELV